MALIHMFFTIVIDIGNCTVGPWFCVGCRQLYPLTNQLLSLVPLLLMEKVIVLYIPHLQAPRASLSRHLHP